jgi:4'-phosphopantetheinyl transferase
MQTIPQLKFLPFPNHDNTYFIEAGDVHLWCIQLDTMRKSNQQYRSLLSREEIERADSFRFDKDKKYFTRAHAIQRILLSRYLGIDPKDLSFTITTFGKPEIASPFIKFSFSHAGDIALLAVSNKRNIGIDVETLNPIPEADQLIERYFSEREMEIFLQSPEKSRNEVFLTFWTRGEAYLKGKGIGLGNQTSDVNLSNISDGKTGWEIRIFYPDENYIGAIAVEGKVDRYLCWYWSESGK